MTSWQVLGGDVFDVVPTIEAGSVRCVVTSPPYWGLRDYGTADWQGGDPEHEHRGATQRTAPAGTDKQASNAGALDVRAGDCTCGAVRVDRQLGLEPTVEEYVARIVEMFRLVRDVLADDGTVWLNLGDTYNAYNGNRGIGASTLEGRKRTPHPERPRGFGLATADLKPKDLIGVPWRVAFALQADGWFLRSDIVWAKPNPMPESVTDRPTRAHEYVFLLTKAGRYYYDADAVRTQWANGFTDGDVRRHGGVPAGWDPTHTDRLAGRHEKRYEDYTVKGANLRDVWNVPTEGFPDAHFATFPKALVRPCILAGSAPGDLVCDPFAGSGTTGLVALREGRSFVGVELNPSYVELARRRIEDDAPLFNIGAEVPS